MFQGKARTGFFKQAKKAYPMFPMMEERIKWDDYGEIIRYVKESGVFKSVSHRDSTEIEFT